MLLFFQIQFVNFFSKFKKKKPEEQATDTSQETQQSEDKIKSIKSKVGQIAERIRKHGSKTERLTAECSKLINANKAIVELNYRIVATTNTNLTQLFTVWQDNIKNISNNRGNMKNVETIINTNYDKMKQLLVAQMQQFANEGATYDELKAAKDYLLASYNLRFNSTLSLSGMLNEMQKLNLGLDFLQKRNDYIRKINLEDVNNAARKYFTPDNLRFITIGDSYKEE